ncbi:MULTISPECIES: hypothetical protein [unclassified Mucilaginibacter]|uniref:hypothetical protein n=1 Tax=unclassified Mucilaginibacter TaxID=2617802 RepID=UPI002AC96F1E|nr:MULTISPECIES: hypothetical protein [unclassified Mucilaginibacter]MEB0263021.1 hypothetical protein [Mucilaginibacter sp. 10I4]MEB0279672.1 hypothetical protein [Mucilaginibacter sp. 10B2]MEB0302476.1 hypothetical protein [Mucilaginibacter sp. 5C4]WPX23768.1 hypothetical protein RHM67_00540 [Mucilaginibacter sp. 5C4]
MLEVVLIIGYIAGTYGFFKILYDMVVGQKLRDIRKSIEFKILIVSVLIVGLCYVPWNKFHFGDIKPKVVYIKVDNPVTSKNQQTKVDSPKKEVIRFKRNQSKSTATTLVDNKQKKTDIPKSQFDLRGAQINGSAVGTNPTVTNNNYETPPRVFSQDNFLELSKGLSKVLVENPLFDKNTTIRYLVAVQDTEALKFADQIYNQMFSNGYKNFEGRYAIFTGIRLSNLTVSKGSENGKDFIAIEIYSQKSVNLK